MKNVATEQINALYQFNQKRKNYSIILSTYFEAKPTVRISRVDTIFNSKTISEILAFHRYEFLN